MDKIDFFIVGAPRSGTTWLNSFLNSHKAIFTIPPNLDKFEFSGILHLLERESREDWQARWGENIQVWDQAIRDFTVSCYKGLKSKYDVKTKLVGIKTPDHSLVIDKIDLIFPDTKFIYIYRNPIDTIASMINTFPQFWPSWKEALEHWKNTNRSILESDAYLDKDRFITIRYEDICIDVDKGGKVIADFLNIENEFDKENYSPHSGSIGKGKKTINLVGRRRIMMNIKKEEIFKNII